MKDEKLAELIFLDEFRPHKEQEDTEWHGLDEFQLPQISDEELDDFQYEYLTGSDLATLTMPEIRWIIRHLVSRSDFEWRKEEAEKMINEILEDREKEDT
jgi:hypothetical protein